MDDVEVLKIPGEMPQVWDRNVIFFANILSLFFGNEKQTNLLIKEVGALGSYGGRLIPLINLIFKGDKNVLVLEREPDQNLIDYFENTLKLKLPEIDILNHKDYCALARSEEAGSDFIDYLKGHTAKTIDGYVTDPILDYLANATDKNTLSTIRGSKKGNNKLLLHEFLVDNNLPIFSTFIAENEEQIFSGLKSLKAENYNTAVVKAPIGASGIGMMKVDIRKDAPSESSFPEHLFYEGSCMVQGWLDSSCEGVEYIGSPSVQMFLRDDVISLHDITDQILSAESVHQGNVSPPPYIEDMEGLKEELLNQAERVSVWVYAMGYRGTASCDFHVIKRGGSFEVRACEVNARVTGATYPTILAGHFMPSAAWLMRNVRFDPPKTSEDIIHLLESEKLLYHPGNDYGILPINFNPDEQNNIVKGQFLFLAKTVERTFDLLNTMCALKSMQGVFDRD